MVNSDRVVLTMELFTSSSSFVNKQQEHVPPTVLEVELGRGSAPYSGFAIYKEVRS